MRTIIIAVAVPVPDGHMPAIESLLNEAKVDGAEIVGVLDRAQPKNNYEPQIFAAFHEEQRRGDTKSAFEERDHGFGVHPGEAGMEHAP